jgi:hydrogenase maturation protease
VTGVGRTMTALVVGLGNRDRGDDAVGPLVAGRVAEQLDGDLPAVKVVEHEDPTGLLDIWADADLAVVVDALRTGEEPGTVVVLEAGAEAEPLPAAPWAGPSRGGTHALGLAASVGLARALGRLPRRLVVVGISAEDFANGTTPSPAVAAAVPRAVDAVLDVLHRGGAG